MQMMTPELLTLYTENTEHINTLASWRIALIALNPKSKNIRSTSRAIFSVETMVPLSQMVPFHSVMFVLTNAFNIINYSND